jgi:hypothetical protein
MEKYAAEMDSTANSYMDEVDDIEITLEQLIDDIIVNEYSVIIDFVWCPPYGIVPSDVIDLDNNSGDDNAVVLLDSRRSGGCIDDQMYRGNNQINVGNALTKINCNSEVVVFSDDDAMQLHENVDVWTDSPHDVYPLDQTPDILAIPVTVWLMTNPNNNVLQRGQNEIAQASMLYNTNNCGIVFNATYQDVSNNNNAVNLVGTNAGNMCTVNWRNNLTTSNFYNAGQINVYYVNGAFRGLTCIADLNIIVIGTTATIETLAHEFGHSLSLDHTNAVAGIPAANLMVGGGTNRTNITEGQCFRCNMNPNSVLNTNGVRIGATRNCPDATTNTRCPDITYDITPN